GHFFFTHAGGTIDVQTGTLNIQLSADASSGGTFTVAAGAVLDLSGGAENTLNGNYTGTGAGLIEVNSGNLIIGSRTTGLAGDTTFNFAGGGFRVNGGA